MLRSLKCDLEKSIINGGFLGAFVITTILCFTTIVYTDPGSSKTYSVFQAISTLDKKTMMDDYFLSSAFVFGQALTGYITMFIPIISVFPFMITFCAERNSGLMRFTITRTGKTKYCFSKFFSCVISGGLSVLLGVVLFGIISFGFFPSISAYDLQPEDLESIFPNGEFIYILKIIISAFVYGAVSSLPAFFLSSFCKNPYVITCIPFMFIYIWNTAVTKITSSMWASNKFDLADKISAFAPDSIVSAINGGFDGTNKTAIIFYMIYTVVFLVGYILIMDCRKDKGV